MLPLLAAPRREGRDFQRGPDLTGLIVVALLAGVVWFALAERDAAWWQWALVVAAVPVALLVAGGALALLFGGVGWIVTSAATRRKRAVLDRLIGLAGTGDTAAALALGREVCGSYDGGYRDALGSPELRARLVALARGGSEVSRACLQVLGEYATWSPDVEAALRAGAQDLSSGDFRWWLAWFRHQLPEGPERGERLAAALAQALPRMDEPDRRQAWSDVLVQAGDTPAWHELAARYREDLVAIQAGGDARMPRARERLELLLRRQ